MFKIVQGDCRSVLAGMPAEFVHMIMTSPPYFGLRDYGIPATVWGGDPACEHEWGDIVENERRSYRSDAIEIIGSSDNAVRRGPRTATPETCFCCNCSAWKGTLGLEPTLELYVKNLVEVFRAVRRVLRSDGVCFINLGDSYFSGAQRATSYGSDDKEPGDYQASDCLCGSLCDACRKAYRIGKSHNGLLRDPTRQPSRAWSSRERRELHCDHVPTSGLVLPDDRNSGAIHGLPPTVHRGRVPPLSVPGSTIDECVQQHLDQRSVVSIQVGGCRLCGRALTPDVHPCDCTMGDLSEPNLASLSTHHQRNIDGTASTDDAFRRRRSDMAYGSYAWTNNSTTSHPLKPKDLCGVPWRVALALQADGWWLRQDIIWHKPNPIPESVTDRCTKAHEYIFMLSKSARYYFDAEAIKEDTIHAGKVVSLGEKSLSRGQATGKNVAPSGNGTASSVTVAAKRNKRSVWTITTRPFPSAHFAVFPPDLVEPCILAGTSEKGVCSVCKAPWRRMVNKTSWHPSCQCNAPTLPAIVLDPFAGAGTTSLVCERLGRDSIGIELSKEFSVMAIKRVLENQEKASTPRITPTFLPMFQV